MHETTYFDFQQHIWTSTVSENDDLAPPNLIWASNFSTSNLRFKISCEKTSIVKIKEKERPTIIKNFNYYYTSMKIAYLAVALLKAGAMSRPFGDTASDTTGSGTYILVILNFALPSVKVSPEEQSTPNTAITSPADADSTSSNSSECNRTRRGTLVFSPAKRTLLPDCCQLLQACNTGDIQFNLSLLHVIISHHTQTIWILSLHFCANYRANLCRYIRDSML